MKPFNTKEITFGPTVYRLEEYLSNDFSSLENVTQIYGIILNPERNSVLLVSKDGKEWTLPGGKPEAGESHIDTLVREAVEEAAVVIDPKTIEPVFYLLSSKKTGDEWVFDGTQVRYFAVAKKVNVFEADPAGDIQFATFVPIADLKQWLDWGVTTDTIMQYLAKKSSGEAVEDQYWLDKGTVDIFASSQASQSFRDFVNEYYNNPDKARALDVGCGGGRNTDFLHGASFEVFGCDKYSSMVKATQKRLKTVYGLDDEYLDQHCLLSPMDRLPFENDYFDLVLSSAVYHNAVSEDELQRALQEANRVLNNSGHMYLHIFYAGDSIGEFEHLKDSLYQTDTGFRMILLPKDRLLGLVAKAGFKIDKIVSETTEKLDVGSRDVIRMVLSK